MYKFCMNVICTSSILVVVARIRAQQWNQNRLLKISDPELGWSNPSAQSSPPHFGLRLDATLEYTLTYLCVSPLISLPILISSRHIIGVHARVSVGTHTPISTDERGPRDPDTDGTQTW